MGVPSGIAKKSSETFLRRFRRCPENPLMSLDEWRLDLWIEALGEDYEDLAEVTYARWKKLRYRNLALCETKSNFLKKLHKQYQLALVTNGPSKSQWEKIHELKLLEYFDCIVVSGDLKYEKPSPEIFQKACASLGVEPYECLMIGDKLDTDIEGGVRAELGVTVWVPLKKLDLGEAQSTPNPPPDFIIDDVTALAGILQGNEKKSKGMKSSKPKVSSSSASSSTGAGTSAVGVELSSSPPSSSSSSVAAKAQVSPEEEV